MRTCSFSNTSLDRVSFHRSCLNPRALLVDQYPALEKRNLSSLEDKFCFFFFFFFLEAMAMCSSSSDSSFALSSALSVTEGGRRRKCVIRLTSVSLVDSSARSSYLKIKGHTCALDIYPTAVSTVPNQQRPALLIFLSVHRHHVGHDVGADFVGPRRRRVPPDLLGHQHGVDGGAGVPATRRGGKTMKLTRTVG